MAPEGRTHALQHLPDAVALLESKATTAELDRYRHFFLALALALEVAVAHVDAQGILERFAANAGV